VTGPGLALDVVSQSMMHAFVGLAIIPSITSRTYRGITPAGGGGSADDGVAALVPALSQGFRR
jgi:hypothetical protein